MTRDEMLAEWLQDHGSSSQYEKLEFVTVHCEHSRENYHADPSEDFEVPVVNQGATPLYYYVGRKPKKQFSNAEVIIWLQVNGLRDYDRIAFNMQDDEASKFIEAWKCLYGW